MSASNDQRSNMLNPNNEAYKQAQINRSRQLNPKDSTYHKARESAPRQTSKSVVKKKVP